MRRFMLIVEVEEGSPTEAVVLAGATLGVGCRLAVTEIPINMVPGCLRRLTDGSVQMQTRNPADWPIVTALGTLDIPALREKVNELVSIVNLVRTFHVT